MADYKLFDINTAATPKPWGPREEQAMKDIIDTLVVDTIDVTKNTGGHLHGKVYASDSVAALDAQTSTSIVLNMRDDISTGLLIKNRNGDNIVEIDSTIISPKATFNYDADIVGKLYGDLYDLYDNLAIQTRHEDKTINFYPTAKGGFDFNLDSSVNEFRIHDDTAELFRIHIPVLDVVGQFDIPVIINDNVNIDGDLDVTGAISYGSLGISGNIAMSTYTINYDGSGSAGLSFNTANELICNDNIGIGINPPTFGTGSGLHIHDTSYPKIHLTNSTTGTTATDGAFLNMNSSDVILYLAETGKILLQNNLHFCGLDSNGYFGVGTSTPSNVLDVDGQSEFNGPLEIIDNKISYDGSTTEGLFFDSNNTAFLYSTPTTDNDIQCSIICQDSTAFNSGVGGGIAFQGKRNVIGTMVNFAGIKGVKANVTSDNNEGQLHFQTNNGTSPVTGMMLDEDGNVGIGTDSPIDKVNVQFTCNSLTEPQGIYINNISNTTGHNASIIFSNDDGYRKKAAISLIDNGTYGYGDLVFTSDGDDAGTVNLSNDEKMRIKSNGNVGIGVDPTNARLEVNSGTADPVAYFESTDTNAKIVLKDSSSTQFMVTQNSILSLGANSAYASFTGNLNIDADGNVGIGTNAPSTKLDIAYGGISMILGADYQLTSRTNSTDKFGSIAIPHYLNAEEPVCFLSYWCGSTINDLRIGGGNGQMNTANQISFWTTNAYNTLTGSSRMVIDSTGNVGIGTAVPTQKLNVYGSGTIRAAIESTNDAATLDLIGNSHVAIIGSQPSGRLDIYTTANEDITLNRYGGNVGINTISPARKLDINSRYPMLLGSDYNSDGDRTNSVTKLAISSSVHYTNAEENVCIYDCYNDSSSNNINIGGGDANFNAATKIRLVTAANNTTVGGTNRVVVDENGYVYMYYLQSSAGDADMRYNTSTGELTYDTSALKYKENIRNNPDTSWIYNIPIKMYDRIDKRKINEIGIIADDLKEIAPAYCCYNKNGDIESYNKSDLVPVLLAEIQKHENRIKHLETRLLQRG